MKNLIIVFFTALVMFSCKTKEKIQTTENIDRYITFNRGSCYGQCPSFKITIFENGNFEYNGKMYVPRIGEYKGKLTNEQSQNLFTKLKTYDWNSYLEKYPIDNTDFPSFSFEYSDDIVIKQVLGNSNAPKELLELTKMMDYLISTLEMKKISE